MLWKPFASSVDTSANCGNLRRVASTSSSARCCSSGVTPGTPLRSTGLAGSYGVGATAAASPIPGMFAIESTVVVGAAVMEARFGVDEAVAAASRPASPQPASATAATAAPTTNHRDLTL